MPGQKTRSQSRSATKPKSSSKSKSCTVINITNKTNLNKVLKTIDTSGCIILYWAKWCGHCQMLKPEWDSFKSIIQEINFPLVEVEYDHLKLLPESLRGIAGFPTIVYKYGPQSIEYTGDRSAKSLVQFAKAITMSK